MRAISNQQCLNLINTEQLYENEVEARRVATSYAYGIRRKRVRGVEYLVRARDRLGNGNLLGRRNFGAEAIHAQFVEGRRRSRERLDAIASQLEEQAAMNRALRLNRVSATAAAVLREIDLRGLRDAICVLGTQVLYGYEAAAGVPHSSLTWSPRRPRKTNT